MSTIFIAELGLNAHGDFDKMKRMCAKAIDAGATYVKGQFYNPYRVLGRNHPALQYALQSQFTRQQHEELAEYCRSLGAPYFVSVFNVGDIGWADNFCSAHKVASRMNRNPEFIARLEQCKKLTFMSVQPTTDQHIPSRFKLMWCVREYPTALETLYKYPYGTQFGLSSHCPDPAGIEYALEHGAKVIEAHICESREETGCDIPASITFDDFKKLVSKTLARI